MIFLVYFWKYIQTSGSPTYKEESEELVNSTYEWLCIRFAGYWNTWIWSTLVSYVAYFGIGGFLQVSFDIFVNLFVLVKIIYYLYMNSGTTMLDKEIDQKIGNVSQKNG